MKEIKFLKSGRIAQSKACLPNITYIEGTQQNLPDYLADRLVGLDHAETVKVDLETPEDGLIALSTPEGSSLETKAVEPKTEQGERKKSKQKTATKDKKSKKKS